MSSGIVDGGQVIAHGLQRREDGNRIIRSVKDFLIYAAHTAFWWAFVITRLVLNTRERRGPGVATSPATDHSHTAPHSRALLAFHSFAFAAMYVGIAAAVLPARVPSWFPGQRVVGTLVILLGAALTSWTLVHFQSWRFRAALDPHHVLATGGPFRLVRHPIYLGLNLLALGSAIWVPTAMTWLGFVLMVIGSDLRGRAEERLLADAFGGAYGDYCAATRRFIPGIY
jgi:protein-S-isoprenylcysteine O-methyltransferase Ste14